MRLIASIVLLLIFTTATALFAEDNSEMPPSVLSIIPGQAQPGSIVVISGSGFSSQSSLFLGINEIPLQSVSPQQISFELPQIPAGNYALFIRQASGTSSKAYSFSVAPVKPAIAALSPDSVSSCSAGDERQIIVKGKNFREGARILFDGAIIKGRLISSEEMSFLTPPVPGGLHQVQVKNPEEAISPAVALLVTSQPEIRAVRQGNDYVNYYELTIEGINFQHGSSLIVDGRKIQSNNANPGERDRLVFTNCNSLTYQRYPYDPSIKSFQLVIVNPNGEESSAFTVSAP